MKHNSRLILVPLFWGLCSRLCFSQNSSALPLTPPPNPRLFNAYIALQAWKHAITSDPKDFTKNWDGPNVCSYTGVFCAPALDDPKIFTVAGIDLNHANIAGTIPEELGLLLSDLALIHINSNRFSGDVPSTFPKLRLLHELDLSNNRFAGEFPEVLLHIPALKFLDIRFNKFEGKIPKQVFELKLDALFINSNNFQSSLPDTLGKSPVSVVVFAGNNLNGCLPRNLGEMGGTLEEIILSNSGLSGCLSPDIGNLTELRVFDVSSNGFVGELPDSMGKMKSLQQLNVGRNNFTGQVPANICALGKLENFTYSENYFFVEPKICLKLKDKDDQRNCLPERPLQRSPEECKSFLERPVNCTAFGCTTPPPPPPSPPPPPPPPPPPRPPPPPPPPVNHEYHHL